jgi:SAM-dependent methyltransferase
MRGRRSRSATAPSTRSCIDSVSHLPERLRALREWHRVLKPGGRILYTDPVVVTGLVSNEELAVRSSIGFFVFAPPGENERLIAAAGFELAEREDASANAAAIAQRWREERFLGLQRFFDVVQRLAGERRLSRIAYLARKPGPPEAAG